MDRFDAKWYLRQYRDVARAGCDPLEHYLAFGRAEGRLPHADPFVTRSLKRARVVYQAVSYEATCVGPLAACRNFARAAVRGGVDGARSWTVQRVQAQEAALRPHQAYRNYIETMEPTTADLQEMSRLQAALPWRPLFSIAVPVYNVEEKWLRRCVDSVRAQVYDRWELCLADDCSTAPHIRPLLEEFARTDPRIKVVYRQQNGHISAATNSALEAATGDYVCLMDNDDEIAPNALFEFAALLGRDPSIDMIYSDEDKIDLFGNRYEPFFKPDWSPEALEGCMYTAHFACYRTSIVQQLGGFRSRFDGAQDYDFVLRFTEVARRIVHVPKVLYHWRAIPGSTAATMDAKNYVVDSAVGALQERVARRAGSGDVRPGPYAGSFDVRYAVQGEPLVSVVIPSAGRSATIRGVEVDLLANVVEALFLRTAYRHIEVIVVDNGDLRPETVARLSRFPCRFVRFEGRFNIATKMNMGAAVAHGEFVMFLNDDIDPIAPDWLECMLQYAQRPGVGAVGAKLRFEDASLQHVGVAFADGLPDHIRRGAPPADPGHFFSSCATRNYLAVTGAVLLTPRALFAELGGFDERFAINYNDVDYCLKVASRGLRNVFAAQAELYHFESVSRERTVAAQEISLFLEKWQSLVRHDPYYSSFFDARPPNFDLRVDWHSVEVPDPLLSIGVAR